jgi:hypothetical protein
MPNSFVGIAPSIAGGGIGSILVTEIQKDLIGCFFIQTIHANPSQAFACLWIIFFHFKIKYRNTIR